MALCRSSTDSLYTLVCSRSGPLSLSPRSAGRFSLISPQSLELDTGVNHHSLDLLFYRSSPHLISRCILRIPTPPSPHLFFIFILFVIAAHVNHVQPVCTFLSRTVMLILIFNSTAYCHAHSFILYILYSVLYILFFIHFILCILPLCCILQYLHCPRSGPDSHFTAGYTISV